MDAEERKEYREYAWNYFSVHANQRMGAFQFYITLSTAILGGAVLMAGSNEDRKWSAVLFLLLPFLSFVFWKLDQRTRGLVKNAERALVHLDCIFLLNRQDSDKGALALFDNDEKACAKMNSKWPLCGYFSYSRCFQYVFIAVALLGFAGGIFATVPASGRKKGEAAKAVKVINECAQGDAAFVMTVLPKGAGAQEKKTRSPASRRQRRGE